MKIAIKNFMRNEDSNLTALSVKYFVPDSKIYLFNLNRGVINHNNLNVDLYEKIIDVKTKYVLGSGYGSDNNGFYYTEGFNIIYDYFKNYNDKLLILDENHFFTNGNTLKEILENNFDLASAIWTKGRINGKFDDMINVQNASCLCINPHKIKHLFPLPEIRDFIENILNDYLFIDKNLTHYIIKNRYFTNYFGYGLYTNNVNKMKRHMRQIIESKKQ